MNAARERTWLEIVNNLPLRSAGPDDFFEELLAVPVDATCDHESTVYYEFLRYQAWHGQEGSISGPSDPRVTAARRWTEHLINHHRSSVAIQQIILLDERFYVREQNRILPKSKWNSTRRSREAGEPAYQSTSRQLEDQWENVLRFLDDHLPSQRDPRQGQITPAELELALVIFDWSHPKPRFAKWLYFSPMTLGEVDGYLLRRYSWRLLQHLEAARRPGVYAVNADVPSDGLPRPDNEPPDFEAKKYRADTGARRRFRLWGIIVVGFISTFAIDSLQHLIWFGPWPISLALAAGAVGVIYLLAKVDVNKQHGGEIDTHIACARATQLSFALLWRSSLFALFATLVMFASCYSAFPDGLFLISDGTTYLTEHPLQTLAGKSAIGVTHATADFSAGVAQWLVATVTLGSLSALLGITVQWLWEDKSAIEPI